MELDVTYVHRHAKMLVSPRYYGCCMCQARRQPQKLYVFPSGLGSNTIRCKYNFVLGPQSKILIELPKLEKWMDCHSSADVHFDTGLRVDK